MRRLLLFFVVVVVLAAAIPRLHAPTWVFVSFAGVVTVLCAAVNRFRQQNARRRFRAWRGAHAEEIERRLEAGERAPVSVAPSRRADGVSVQPGRLVAGILNSAASRFWAKEGYGRRMVFLFQDAVLILETDRAGKPLGADRLELNDEAIVAMPLHARDMAALDSRNALVWIRDIASARLSGRRKYGLYCLELHLRNGREFTFHWRAKHAWRTVVEQYAFPIPDHPEEVAVRDLQAVFGALLADETDA